MLVIRGQRREVIERRPIPTGTNLLRLFLVTVLEYIDGGWRVDDVSALGGTFSARREASEVRHVSVETRSSGSGRDA